MSKKSKSSNCRQLTLVDRKVTSEVGPSRSALGSMSDSFGRLTELGSTLFYTLEAIATRVEAIATRAEAIAIRLEAIYIFTCFLCNAGLRAKQPRKRN